MSISNTPQNTYVYSRLPQRHIRLIRLQPSLDNDTPLRFSFWISSLNEARGEYDAVSYTWGSLDLTHEIFCAESLGEDEYAMAITENLFKVLKRFRHRLDERVLWADALCINQKDNEDKAQQIPMMDHIYRGARHVVAWLGDGGTDVEMVLRTLGRLTEVPKGRAEHEDITYIERALPLFLNLPWFRRMWIIQEAVLNMDMVLVCGSAELSMVKFVSGLDIVRSMEYWSSIGLVPGAIAVVNTIKIWKQYRSEADTTDLKIVNLVNQATWYECGDDRDRIYALYSMASDIGSVLHEPARVAGLGSSQSSHVGDDRQLIFMDVDYNADVQEVYTRFAIACLRSTAILDLLVAVLERLYRVTKPDWPSWVPDWRRPRLTREHNQLRRRLNGEPSRKPTIELLTYEPGEKIRLRSKSGIYSVGKSHVARKDLSLYELLEWSTAEIGNLREAQIGFFSRLFRSIWNPARPMLEFLVKELCLENGIDPTTLKDSRGRVVEVPYLSKSKKQARSLRAMSSTRLDSMLNGKSVFIAFFPTVLINRRYTSSASDTFPHCAMGMSSVTIKEGDRILRLPTDWSQGPKVDIREKWIFVEQAFVLRPSSGNSSSYRIVGDATMFWSRYDIVQTDREGEDWSLRFLSGWYDIPQEEILIE